MFYIFETCSANRYFSLKKISENIHCRQTKQLFKCISQCREKEKCKGNFKRKYFAIRMGTSFENCFSNKQYLDVENKTAAMK